MKSLLLICALSPACLLASEPYELEIPSLEDQFIVAQQSVIDDLIKELEENDAFAGKLTEVFIMKKRFVVDRTAEAPKAPTGNAPRAPRVGSILNDLGVKASGQVRIRVTHKTFDSDSGKVTAEDIWEIDFGGAWQAQDSSMVDVVGKLHK